MNLEEVAILAIESSCDDTAAAVIQGKTLLSNVVSTQLVHQNYGGVVPELASRDHQKNIVSIVKQALTEATIQTSDLDAIAYTQGPGLLGSLIVGCCFAKSMALALDLPLISINHMHAHVLSPFIEAQNSPLFPFICLTASGGHTQLVYVEDYLRMRVIGQTLDDAMGEAFDKVGKMMNLPYPAGPIIDNYAKMGSDSGIFTFPDTRVPGLDFSFSGIKTAFMQFLQKNMVSEPKFIEANIYDISASIQNKIVGMAMDKLRYAVRQTNVRAIAIAGGVAANSALRTAVTDFAKDKSLHIYIPQKKYCTDNAAMVAITSHYKFLAQDFQDIHSAVPMPRLEF
jgi:N6-L-threonylcarbamoyladenine synthase